MMLGTAWLEVADVVIVAALEVEALSELDEKLSHVDIISDPDFPTWFVFTL